MRKTLKNAIFLFWGVIWVPQEVRMVPKIFSQESLILQLQNDVSHVIFGLLEQKLFWKTKGRQKKLQGCTFWLELVFDEILPLRSKKLLCASLYLFKRFSNTVCSADQQEHLKYLHQSSHFKNWRVALWRHFKVVAKFVTNLAKIMHLWYCKYSYSTLQ